MTNNANKHVLITGAGGYVGKLVTTALANDPNVAKVIATDIRDPRPRERVLGAEHRVLDIRDEGLADLLQTEQIDTVVHLAAIVTPRPGMGRDFLHDVEVGGTRNVLESCVKAGVGRFVYTSSGAAYGYHADNDALLTEDSPLRGNAAFAYSHHKRLIEVMLAEFRAQYPELEQVVFRVSTILGPSVANQITAMFERPVVVGVAGADTPFCFVSDGDVVGCVVRAVLGGPAGTYNLTGDGVMTLREVAAAMGRRYVAIPRRALQFGLTVLSERGLSPYGPEQIAFLQYRPVMSNERLKRTFGYRPGQSSRQVFETYRAARA